MVARVMDALPRRFLTATMRSFWSRIIQIRTFGPVKGKVHQVEKRQRSSVELCLTWQPSG